MNKEEKTHTWKNQHIPFYTEAIIHATQINVYISKTKQITRMWNARRRNFKYERQQSTEARRQADGDLPWALSLKNAVTNPGQLTWSQTQLALSYLSICHLYFWCWKQDPGLTVCLAGTQSLSYIPSPLVSSYVLWGYKNSSYLPEGLIFED